MIQETTFVKTLNDVNKNKEIIELAFDPREEVYNNGIIHFFLFFKEEYQMEFEFNKDGDNLFLISKEENIKLRKESYASISVIPEVCFEEKILSKVSVDIPLYLILRFPDFFKYDDNRKVIIADIPYSSKEGLQFLDLNESMSVYFENII